MHNKNFQFSKHYKKHEKTLRQQFVEDPRNYLELVQYGYTDETDKLQNPPPPTPLRGMGAPPPPPPEPPARMAEGGPMFMRNEPNIFSIDADITNLMTEYDMVVRNIPFAETIEEKQMAEMRAQNLAKEIDQLNQQKIALQLKNNPTVGDLPLKIFETLNEPGIANTQKQTGMQPRNEIDSILNRIKIR